MVTPVCQSRVYFVSGVNLFMSIVAVMKYVVSEILGCIVLNDQISVVRLNMGTWEFFVKVYMSLYISSHVNVLLW